MNWKPTMIRTRHVGWFHDRNSRPSVHHRGSLRPATARNAPSPEEGRPERDSCHERGRLRPSGVPKPFADVDHAAWYLRWCRDRREFWRWRPASRSLTLRGARPALWLRPTAAIKTVERRRGSPLLVRFNSGQPHRANRQAAHHHRGPRSARYGTRPRVGCRPSPLRDGPETTRQLPRTRHPALPGRDDPDAVARGAQRYPNVDRRPQRHRRGRSPDRSARARPRRAAQPLPLRRLSGAARAHGPTTTSPPATNAAETRCRMPRPRPSHLAALADDVIDGPERNVRRCGPGSRRA